MEASKTFIEKMERSILLLERYLSTRNNIVYKNNNPKYILSDIFNFLYSDITLKDIRFKSLSNELKLYLKYLLIILYQPPFNYNNSNMRFYNYTTIYYHTISFITLGIQFFYQLLDNLTITNENFLKLYNGKYIQVAFNFGMHIVHELMYLNFSIDKQKDLVIFNNKQLLVNKICGYLVENIIGIFMNDIDNIIITNTPDGPDLIELGIDNENNIAFEVKTSTDGSYGCINYLQTHEVDAYDCISLASIIPETNEIFKFNIQLNKNTNPPSHFFYKSFKINFNTFYSMIERCISSLQRTIDLKTVITDYNIDLEKFTQRKAGKIKTMFNFGCGESWDEIFRKKIDHLTPTTPEIMSKISKFYNPPIYHFAKDTDITIPFMNIDIPISINDVIYRKTNINPEQMVIINEIKEKHKRKNLELIQISGKIELNRKRKTKLEEELKKKGTEIEDIEKEYAKLVKNIESIKTEEERLLLELDETMRRILTEKEGEEEKEVKQPPKQVVMPLVMPLSVEKPVRTRLMVLNEHIQDTIKEINMINEQRLIPLLERSNEIKLKITDDYKDEPEINQIQTLYSNFLIDVNGMIERYSDVEEILKEPGNDNKLIKSNYEELKKIKNRIVSNKEQLLTVRQYRKLVNLQKEKKESSEVQELERAMQLSTAEKEAMEKEAMEKLVMDKLVPEEKLTVIKEIQKEPEYYTLMDFLKVINNYRKLKRDTFARYDDYKYYMNLEDLTIIKIMVFNFFYDFSTFIIKYMSKTDILFIHNNLDRIDLNLFKEIENKHLYLENIILISEMKDLNISPSSIKKYDKIYTDNIRDIAILMNGFINIQPSNVFYYYYGGIIKGYANYYINYLQKQKSTIMTDKLFYGSEILYNFAINMYKMLAEYNKNNQIYHLQYCTIMNEIDFILYNFLKNMVIRIDKNGRTLIIKKINIKDIFINREIHKELIKAHDIQIINTFYKIQDEFLERERFFLHNGPLDPTFKTINEDHKKYTMDILFFLEKIHYNKLPNRSEFNKYMTDIKIFYNNYIETSTYTFQELKFTLVKSYIGTIFTFIYIYTLIINKIKKESTEPIDVIYAYIKEINNQLSNQILVFIKYLFFENEEYISKFIKDDSCKNIISFMINMILKIEESHPIFIRLEDISNAVLIEKRTTVSKPVFLSTTSDVKMFVKLFIKKIFDIDVDISYT